MAGRRGKCPRGHAIVVPAGDPAPAVENEFAFTSGPFVRPPRTTPRPRSGPPPPRPAPDPAPAGGDDFSAFPHPTRRQLARDEEGPAPKTGKHRKLDRKAAGTEGKPNLMPLILGGILALLGIGGGVTLLVVSRGEAGPLREQAEAANKKAAAAEDGPRRPNRSSCWPRSTWRRPRRTRPRIRPWPTPRPG